MGMSASQMRYCMLTGRKSDVEYQGQQINQQRTTLATQSSALNTQLLDMSVPTPPSTSEYSTTTYTFTSDSGETCTITSAQYQSSSYSIDGSTRNYDGGTYIINYTDSTTADVGKRYGTKSVSYDATNQIYTIGSGDTTTTLTAVDLSDPSSDDFTNVLRICQDCNLQNANNTNIETSAALTTYATSDSNSTKFYSYTSGGTTYYIQASEISSLTTAASGTSVDAGAYYIDEDADITETGQIGGAKVTWSDSGRMESFVTSDANSNKTTYSLSVSSTTDNEAYSSAYQEYTYQKGVYDKAMEDINASICIIESEDKKLELKLKDLDTQQEALNTEIDSVKKVIDKNIENSFKAFA